MNRVLAAAGALALAAFLSAGEARAQTLPAGNAKGGNKALMEDWVRKKQALRDQVVGDLRKKGLLPRDGSVSFQALVKPDPNNPGRIQVIRIQSLSIQEKAKPARNGAADPIFGPRTPNAGHQTYEGSIPVGGGSMSESITIIGGKPQP